MTEQEIKQIEQETKRAIQEMRNHPDERMGAIIAMEWPGRKIGTSSGTMNIAGSCKSIINMICRVIDDVAEQLDVNPRHLSTVITIAISRSMVKKGKRPEESTMDQANNLQDIMMMMAEDADENGLDLKGDEYT